MLTKNSWKTAILCVAAILFGIVCGPFVANLAGGLWAAASQPSAAQAAEAAPAVVVAPGSPEATYICTPSYVGSFPNRVHVLCTVAAPGGIFYFATPTSDSKNAARLLTIMLTAKALGKNLQIYYDPGGNGTSFSCQVSDCRPILGIEMTN
jgi:hypothetical protein